MQQEDKDLVALFEGLDTPGVSDAMDKLGLPGHCFGLAPLADYAGVTVGPAFTVKYVPASTPAGSVGDFIDEVAEGDVLVIDNGGRTDCTVWGDIMTQYAGQRRIAATVIDGVCRDVSKALDDGYPLFTRGRFMRTGKDRVQVEDANGVLVVPRARAREVAELARGIEAAESQIRAWIAEGKTLGEARAAMGYHTLQRKAP
jgi:regulator of RNase E activity RraA